MSSTTSRAQHIASAAWERHRCELIDAYLNSRDGTKRVIEIMAKKETLMATTEQVRYQFRKWAVFKNLKAAEACGLSKDSEPSVQGNVVIQRKLERHKKRLAHKRARADGHPPSTSSADPQNVLDSMEPYTSPKIHRNEHSISVFARDCDYPFHSMVPDFLQEVLFSVCLPSNPRYQADQNEQTRSNETTDVVDNDDTLGEWQTAVPIALGQHPEPTIEVDIEYLFDQPCFQPPILEYLSNAGMYDWDFMVRHACESMDTIFRSLRPSHTSNRPKIHLYELFGVITHALRHVSVYENPGLAIASFAALLVIEHSTNTLEGGAPEPNLGPPDSQGLGPAYVKDSAVKQWGIYKTLEQSPTYLLTSLQLMAIKSMLPLLRYGEGMLRGLSGIAKATSRQPLEEQLLLGMTEPCSVESIDKFLEFTGQAIQQSGCRKAWVFRHARMRKRPQQLSIAKPSISTGHQKTRPRLDSRKRTQ